MNPRYPSDFISLSVRRPILTVVGNLLIILAGLASLLGVDVRELPDVDRPVVGVRASYQGASPKTMDAEVTSLIEGAIARVPGVKTIRSSSEENNMRIRAEFEPGVNLNEAASDVREAVSRVQRDLPDDVDKIIVLKADADASPIIQLGAPTGKLTQEELAERLEKDVIPELVSIDGVAEVRAEGQKNRVLRVLLDPARLAGYRINVTDIIAALRTARFDVPAGSYKSLDQELLVRAYASVIDPTMVEMLHVRDNIRLSDLGSVQFTPETPESFSLLNGQLIVGLEIIRQAGTNTISIASEVARRIVRINQRARDFELNIISDDSVYIKGALSEVILSLLASILIVLVLIWLFLGSWRSVLIPAVTMPVSLIGTVAAVWLCGFSINLLTLLSLVLATGLIVDDAIVVLENIQRFRGRGIRPLAAAVLGTRQVYFAVIATTITLVSVFIPIAFLPGEAGRMFREFGLVLGIAVMISSFVALTLCPMMASKLLAEVDLKPSYFRRLLDWLGQYLAQGYMSSLQALMKIPLFIILISISLASVGWYLFFNLDQELVPTEDRGALEIILTGPDGASLSYADKQVQQVEQILEPYKVAGLITNVYTIVGRWDRNRSYTKVILADWNQRTTSQMKLASELKKDLAKIVGSQVRLRQPSSLQVRGAGTGIQLALLGTDYDEMYEFALQLTQKLESSIPEISDVRIQFENSQPELAYNIDREKAQDLGVSMEVISQTLRVMVDEYDLLNLSFKDQSIPLVIGSSKGAIKDPGDLLNIFVTNNSGQLVPLSALIKVQERGVSAELDRYAQRRAIELDIGLKPTVAVGTQLERIRSVIYEVLPPGMNFIFLGEAATLEDTSHEIGITFLIAVLVVFLVLAAQFESFGSAVIVSFTVPFGLALAVFMFLLTSQSLNLYSQIGLVMLVGLMTKNAILLVEFMDQLRDEGRTVNEAILEGAKVRLRPIAMTVFSTVLGSLPLILSTGPGFEARNSIGWVIFGGLGFSIFITLYLAPIGYALIAPHLRERGGQGRLLDLELKKTEGNTNI